MDNTDRTSPTPNTSPIRHPFCPGPPVKPVDGQWTTDCRRGHGQTDGQDEVAGPAAIQISALTQSRRAARPTCRNLFVSHRPTFGLG
ncbi:hypothetical protein J6590_054138 [Homalodisca vitripennis]|nr:hypothetical protein J6590_054138 [Homalodisca vitripennis]